DPRRAHRDGTHSETPPDRVDRLLDAPPGRARLVHRLVQGRLHDRVRPRLEPLRPDADEPHREAPQVDPRDELARDEVDLARDVRRGTQGPRPRDGAEVARADFDAHGARDEMLTAQAAGTAVGELEHARLDVREVTAVVGEGRLGADAALGPAGLDGPGVAAPREVVQVRAGDLPDRGLQHRDVGVRELG